MASVVVSARGRARLFPLAVILALSGIACASSSAGSEVQTALVADGGGDTASSCSADRFPAVTKVMAATEANSACSTAADCTTIEFSTSCFDSCSRAVATSGQAAVDAAKTAASANECQAFVAEGCKVEAPPCTAPSAPACVAGKCT